MTAALLLALFAIAWVWVLAPIWMYLALWLVVFLVLAVAATAFARAGYGLVKRPWECSR